MGNFPTKRRFLLALTWKTLSLASSFHMILSDQFVSLIVARALLFLGSGAVASFLSSSGISSSLELTFSSHFGETKFASCCAVHCDYSASEKWKKIDKKVVGSELIFGTKEIFTVLSFLLWRKIIFPTKMAAIFDELKTLISEIKFSREGRKFVFNHSTD